MPIAAAGSKRKRSQTSLGLLHQAKPVKHGHIHNKSSTNRNRVPLKIRSKKFDNKHANYDVANDIDELIASDSNTENEISATEKLTTSSNTVDAAENAFANIETEEEARLRIAKSYVASLTNKLGSSSDFFDDRESDSDDDEDSRGVTRSVDEVLQADVLRRKRKHMIDLSSCIRSSFSISDVRVLKHHYTPVTCISLSSDDSCIASGSKDGSIVLSDTSSNCRLYTFPRSQTQSSSRHTVHAVAISHDVRLLASGGDDCFIHLWDLRSQKCIQTVKRDCHRDTVCSLAWSSEGDLYSGSFDRSLKVWSQRDDSLHYVDSLFGHQAEITQIASINRDRVLTVGRDKTLRLFKTVEETQLLYKGGHVASIDSCCLINDSLYLSGGQDGTVCLWSAHKKKPITTITNAHSDSTNNSSGGWVSSVSALPFSDVCFTAGSNGRVCAWKISANALLPLATIPMTGFVNAMAVSSTGRFLAAAVGQEHRFGRWWRDSSAKNSIQIVNLLSEN